MAALGNGSVVVAQPVQAATFTSKELVGAGTIPDPLGRAVSTTLWPATTTTITTWPVVP
jgi:hypothetical protein